MQSRTRHSRGESPRLMMCGPDTGVIDWVAEHPETLAVLDAYGIDYCCGGKSLAFACREQGLDTRAVLAVLCQTG
jgi:iron-sulfur cluster repair protein YtfE (RIC family)